MAALTDNIGLVMRIRADSSEAQADFKKFKKDLNDLEKDAKDSGTALERMGASAGLSAAQFDTLKVGALAAVAGITAVVAAATTAAVAIFSLTEASSEYGSKLFDAQAKTKLSAETLSTLAANAAKAGSDFDSVIGSVSKFTVLLGQAQTEGGKAAATLAQYGITSLDTATALDQAITAIAAMETVEQRAAAAREIFKDKTLALLPVIEQMSGSLSDATKETIRTGQAMTQQGIAASDDFGDALTDLRAQAASLGRTFAVEMMPKMTQALQSVSAFMVANKDQAAAWGNYLINTLTGLTIVFQGLGKAAEDTFNIITLGMARTKAGSETFGNVVRAGLDFAFAGLPSAIANLERIGRLMPDSVNSGPLKYADPRSSNTTPYTGVFSSDGMKKRDDYDYDQEQKRIEEAKKAAEKAAEERKKARERDLAAQQDNVKRQIDVLNEYFDTDQKGFEDAYLRREITEDQWRETSERNYEIYAAKVKKLLLDAFKLDAIGKTPLEIENLRLTKGLGNKAVDDAVVRERENREKSITGIIKKENAQREKDQKDSDQRAKEEFDRWLAYIEGQVNEETEKWKRMMADQAAVTAFLAGSTLPVPEMSTEGTQKPGVFDGFKNSWQEFFDLVWNTAPTLGSMLTDVAGILQNAFSGFANALGSVVENFVLMGTTGPAFIKKILAASLASIAAESAVRAIFELAKGFASLFFNPAEAAAHFQSAALFGSIAVGAGVAGRAIAGDSFAQQTSGGGAGASNSAGGQSQSDSYSSGQFGGFGQRLNNTLAQVEETTNRLATKIAGFRPGDVLGMGVEENPNAVSDGLISGLQNNSRLTGALKRATGDV